MRVQEWEFADATHPVYERPPGATQWPDPLPGMLPSQYDDSPARGTDREPLQMGTEGFPSAEVYQAPGGDTIQKVALNTKYADDIDITEIEQLGREWIGLMRRMSMGPHSADDLREMGYPYGYGKPADTKGGYTPAEPASWDRLSRPRQIPSMGAHRRVRGARGSVPNRSIINTQSGGLVANWYFRLMRWYGGVTMLFGNRAFQSWFLAHGTIKMQAHGPWAIVAQRLLPKLHKAWRLAAYRAWRRQMQRAQTEQLALVGQFGGAALEPNREYEAGGFG